MVDYPKVGDLAKGTCTLNVLNQNAWFDVVESGSRLSCECCCRSCSVGPSSLSLPWAPALSYPTPPGLSSNLRGPDASPGKKIKAGLCANLHPRALMSTSHPASASATASAADSDLNLEVPLRSLLSPSLLICLLLLLDS